MLKQITFANTLIRFEDRGSGFPIVLLHGFMESLDAWDEFASELEKDFRVIAIDLPGHGKSGLVDYIHTMDIMAAAVKAVLDFAGLKNVALVGHSMGGYTALQFLKDYPDYVRCLVLFHSTPFADTEDRKKAREQMINDVKAGKKVSFAKDFVQKTFAPQNVDKLVKQIGFMKIIALNTQNEGIIAALEGMKQRPSYVDLVEKAPVPILWILGKHDNFIPADVYKQLSLPSNVTVEVLEHSGHQGYIEQKKESLEMIKKFVNKCID